METRALAATTPPLLPRPLRRFDEPPQTPNVAADTDGVDVAAQPSSERGVLGLTRRGPVASTPVVAGLLGPSEARPPGLAPPPPTTWSGTRPRARAPQKVEGGQTCAAVLLLGWTPAGQQPRLGWGESQSEAPSPFPEYRQHPSRLVLALKANDAVITIPDQGGFPPPPWLHLCLEPPIAYIVPVDVPQPW